MKESLKSNLDLQKKPLRSTDDPEIIIKNLEMGLAEVSFDNIFGILGRLSDLKTLGDTRLETYKFKVSEYYKQLRSQIREFNPSGTESYLEFTEGKLKKLWSLTQFEGFIEIDSASLFKEISELEKEMREYLKKNPNALSEFLAEKRKKLLLMPDMMDNAHERKKLEPLTLADPGIQEVNKEGKINLIKTFKGQSWVFRVFFEDYIAVVSQKDPDTFVVLDIKKLIELLENNKFSQIAEMASKNSKQRLNVINIAEDFDLPKEQPIEYLRIFPRKYDEIIAEDLHSSMILQSALQRNYSNLRDPLPIFSDNPKAEIVPLIAKAYNEGTRVFFLDIASHGSEEAILFKNPLKASDFAEISKQFPEAKFIIHTIACYGGGLREGFLAEFKKSPELKERFSVLLQSKPNVPNPSAFLEDTEESFQTYSTYYELFFIDALQKGMRLGQAAIYADDMIRKFAFSDPEMLINGVLVTKTEKTPEVKYT